MKRPLSDRLAPLVFTVSLAALGTLYGTLSSWWGWFPAPQIGLAHSTMMDIQRNWQNDLSLKPTRHLVKPDDTETPADPDRGLTVYAPEKVQPGYTLVAGLNTERDSVFHIVRLFDEKGEEVHSWPIRYDALDEERKPRNVMLHGMEVFEDGSLAVAFDSGQAVARIDACGKPMWSMTGNFHHSLQRDGQGNLLTWRDERMVWLDEDTGEELQSLDLHSDVMDALDGEQRGYLDIRTVTPEQPNTRMRYLEDPFHPNDVEPLRADMADAFPMFEAGDVLMSLRELNLVAVVDPDNGEMKWWQHGPWIKQHDPDFQPDGTITVYDNATATGSSKIRRIDPKDDSMTIEFAGSEQVPFYSWRRGKHQVLPNGNILLTEAEHGRILSVDPDGALVWDRHMAWDAESNVVITEARHVAPDFFTAGVPSCQEELEVTELR